ncbi:ribosome biogenesis protein SLX9 homolog isoform X2 [Saccopteryx bilineata]|uniref:ribosome biogenesis protein SLX9 homolog isoform X2 n=1 Tax=Saccopteryx bilineata TaxID=59482 RepID=UPI00338F1138
MGKVRGLRARVHQAAVRLRRESTPGLAPQAQEATPPQASAGRVGWKEWVFVSTDVFAKTRIDSSTLVQKLDVETQSVTSIRRDGEVKAVLPKKEKRKLRRERWLQKIEAIKLAEQKHKAERRRRATVIVGDLQPLRDALPELLELEVGARRPHTRGTSSKPQPAELSRMSAAQRLQLLFRGRGVILQECLSKTPVAMAGLQGLLNSSCPIASRSEEERTRFQDLLANPAYRASPLLAIGQQLARQMQLDGGGLL